MSKCEYLINLISEVFSERKYPGDDIIVDKKEIANIDSVKVFLGRNWQDVDYDDLDDNLNTSCLSLDGAVYYCPAVLIALLKFRKEKSAHDFIVKYIYDSAPNDMIIEEWEMAKVLFKEKLSFKQKAAVCEFIKFMKNPDDGRLSHDEAEISLKGSWAIY